MSGLDLALGAAALLAGLCGTWSPCGFSMIETIGPVGHRGGRPTTIAACVTFAIGALAGGVITFGALSLAGAALQGADQTIAYIAGAALAVVAALAELRGVPILPQLRRQLPEHWRRVMPMPLAAALYGVLLGLGFTTFVLTFGVFALAGIAFALGDPQVGVGIGLAFGVGRALPIVTVAPIADRDAGIAVTEAMAGRPEIYRGFRIGDGLALLAAAAALVVAAPAGAAHIEAKPAADPSVAGRAVVFQRPNRTAYLRRGGRDVRLPGHDAALGDGRLAVIAAGEIRLLSATDLSEIGHVHAKGADAVAVSRHWVAWRARRHGRDFMRARNVSDPRSPGPEHSLGRAGGSGQLGRPGLDDNRLVYARATTSDNVIVRRLLGAKHPKRAKSVLLRSRSEGLSNPSLRGRSLLYVRNTRRADRLKLKRVGGHGPGRTLLSRRGGTLWSTALSDRRAYVTLIHGTKPRQRILSVAR
jgi:hypothetical protein